MILIFLLGAIRQKKVISDLLLLIKNLMLLQFLHPALLGHL